MKANYRSFGAWLAYLARIGPVKLARNSKHWGSKSPAKKKVEARRKANKQAKKARKINRRKRG